MLDSIPYLNILILLSYIIGFLCATLAILRSRTPQGSIAWVIALITIPFITVPMFFIFGSSKFLGYNHRITRINKKTLKKLNTLQEKIIKSHAAPIEMFPFMKSVASLSRTGFTSSNKIELLVDAKDTYSRMLGDIEKAQKYILFQFYVFRADGIGNTFADLLIKKAREGIDVNVLYDEIGSGNPEKIIERMTLAGVKVAHFNSSYGHGYFQVNFRNHRKLIVIDGKVAFIGGINIGDDYLGLWPSLGNWRDTNTRLEGPSVIACQLSHTRDWYWSKEEDLDVDWNPVHTDGNANVLILPTGPADDKKVCLLAYTAIVNTATERLWMANPYFVPPESLLDAIVLAALRGVDVRLLIPGVSDARIVMSASEVYIHRLMRYGVKVFRYQHGFLHQKVILVDDLLGVLGSTNLDYRSMFLNFELSVIAQDKDFVKSVERMLLEDFKLSQQVLLEEYINMSLWKKITTRAANLVAPML